MVINQCKTSSVHSSISRGVGMPSKPGRVTECEASRVAKRVASHGSCVLNKRTKNAAAKTSPAPVASTSFTAGARKRRRSPFQYKTAPAASSVTARIRVSWAMCSISSSSPATSSRLITTAPARTSAESASIPFHARHTRFSIPLTHPALRR